MGYRLYKSVKLGKGVRLNFSKTGVGISAGVRGARYSVHSSGRTTKTVGIPGSGLSYRKDSYARGPGSARQRSRTVAPPPPSVQMYPKAGLLAPKEEKLFVKGVTAYMQGRFEQAVQLLRDVSGRDAAHAHVGEEFFEGMSLVGLSRLEEAIEPLEAVLASDQDVPDALMHKYGVGGSMAMTITDHTEATMPISTLSAALMLAEVYQRTNREQKAIELLESLGALEADPLFALSLAELYSEASRWDDVIRVTDGFVTNEDDVTLEILCRRANALIERGMPDAARELTKAALRSKKRNPDLLRLARYVRGLTYERQGKAGLARKEFEKVYAEDRRFADVALRLGLRTESESEGGSPPRPDLPV